MRKLLLSLIIAIGTLGCGGFPIKSPPSAFPPPSPHRAGAFDSRLHSPDLKRYPIENREKNLMPVGPVEASSPAEVESRREADDSYFLCHEVEARGEDCPPSETLSLESRRSEGKEADPPPSEGPANKGTAAPEEKHKSWDTQVLSSETQGNSKDKISWVKNIDENGAETVVLANRSEEAVTPELETEAQPIPDAVIPSMSEESKEPFSWEPSSPALAVFPSLLNSRVEDFINFFCHEADSFFNRALGRSTAYANMMKKIFREKNLPEELFYLALIESGFNHKAFSRAKASGIWQFIGKTAKRFGLKVDPWVDERRDPEKATHAAAEYLKSLYALFNNWDLATASYNAGEGKMMKAIEKADSQDFWKISQHRFLKKETKEYVPMFLAAVTIAKDPHKFGFRNIEYSPPLVYEKVIVPPATSLTVIARAAESDLSAIRLLNPALKKGETPPYSSFEIKLPPEKRETFLKNFLRIKHIKGKQKKHRVRKGENLFQIARKYRLTLRELCALNDLSPQKRISPGTVLLLPPVFKKAAGHSEA